MLNENTQKLAEKIANFLQNDSGSDEFQRLQVSIEKLNERLDGIENKLDERTPNSAPRILNASHPSLEKYDVIEAIADEVIANQQSEKTCTFEPNGKPCDFCSMCSSHGF